MDANTTVMSDHISRILFIFSPYHPVQHGQDLFWWIPERSVNPPPPSIFVGNEVIGLRQPPSFLLLTVAQIKETTRRGWEKKMDGTKLWHLPLTPFDLAAGPIYHNSRMSTRGTFSTCSGRGLQGIRRSDLINTVPSMGEITRTWNSTVQNLSSG